jgi:hypothetical protein
MMFLFSLISFNLNEGNSCWLLLSGIAKTLLVGDEPAEPSWLFTLDPAPWKLSTPDSVAFCSTIQSRFRIVNALSCNLDELKKSSGQGLIQMSEYSILDRVISVLTTSQMWI